MTQKHGHEQRFGNSAEGVRERTERFMAAAVVAARAWYDLDGEWIADTKPAETRERLWLAGALYSAGENTWADAVVAQGETARYGNIRFNIFDTNFAVALLLAHRGKMSVAVRERLECLVRDGFSFKPGNRQPDYQFHGYNDNMPAEATVGLILGGEMLDCRDAVEHGLWNLRQLRAMLVRNGTISEFNSPTYAGATLHAMSEIAEHARDVEARRLALGIEERLWIDIAARFHPELGVMAGPYSRAYTVDTIAHSSCMSSLLWFCLGDRVNPSPMDLYAKPEELILHHMGDIPFNVAQFCFLASGVYHIPDVAMQMFDRKMYPFRAVATNELGDSGADFPARACRIETMLYPEYALGTSSTPMGNGSQSCSYFVTYKRTEQVTSFRDIGTVFAKMSVNGEVPGNVSRAAEIAAAGEEYRDRERRTPKVYANAGEEDCLASHANTFTLQAESTALVLTHPHLSLGGSDDGAEPAKPLTGLDELIILPTHGGDVEELIVGGIPRERWSGEVERGQWIVCRTGRLLAAFRPLAYTRTIGPVRIMLESNGNYRFIRIEFYRGEPRLFTRSELSHCFGGFAAEHSGLSEYPSLAAFAKECVSARFTDYFWTTRRVQYRRPAGIVRPALDLEASWSPGAATQRYATINGNRVDCPIAEIDGLQAENLPFVSEPYAAIPPYFPWKDFKVEWGDWPYAIGDRDA
ncbi:hypothetical protein [Cohnella fermenti]|uniref:Alginate lyase domain-containing protein n=1 Tax=Cohnella fermenti TaxID=2565925 RepID=A0A4V3WEK8_9BACL|nr:hypothetical protein [Cohnella fermenti]THF76705.1 hypothetical protein E6C55_18210 [Cohnella fermenti]